MGLTVAGLFAGIGGIELGLQEAGHRTVLLSEIDSGAQRVLSKHLLNVPIVGDVRELISLPPCDLVAAGFPCQDLSQAGRTAGISGAKSGVVQEVFRLISRDPPRWLLLENVPFMLQLDRGAAMRHLTTSLEALGFDWAYRIVDSRSFGIPQRRQRVIMLASPTEDPRAVLFAGSEDEPRFAAVEGAACGFYWTEGVRGLGWAVDAVPTLKGGSTIGIPSPPAILMPDGFVGLPTLSDAERLQGFPAGWTEPAGGVTRRSEGTRWKLVGNAVNTRVAHWIGRRLNDPVTYDDSEDRTLVEGESWPRAAAGIRGRIKVAPLSVWPERCDYSHLADFLVDRPVPLSLRAAEGFLTRTRRSTLNFPPHLLQSLEAHVRAIRGEQLVA